MIPPAGPDVLWLQALHRVEPHQFNSFYRRTRVIRRRPRPLPPQVFVEVTRSCPFRCAFCMASATRGGGHVPLSALEALFEALRGIPRLVLIGGEPTVHPSFPALLELAQRTAAEVEVFTNGLPFLRDDPGLLGTGVRWTLSVDRFHREEFGPPRFEAMLQRVLAMRDRGLPVAFNLTGPEFHTVGYVDADTVAGMMGDFSDRLREDFLASLHRGDTDLRFLFNPVVCTGDGVLQPQAEAPFLEDLLWPSDLVFRYDGPGWRILSDLPSLWTAEEEPAVTVGCWRPGDPPGSLTLGFVQGALDLQALGLPPGPVLRRLASLVTPPGASLPDCPFPPGPLPRGDPLCKALEEASDGDFPGVLQGVRALRALAFGSPDWLDDRLAGALFRLANGIPRRTFEVVRRNQFSPVHGPVIRRWLSRIDSTLPGSWRATLPGIVGPLEALFFDGDRPAFPYDLGRRRYFGRVLQEEPEDLRPLGSRRQSDLEVRLFWTEARPRVALEGVRPLSGASAGRSRLVCAIETLRRALGERLPAAWVADALTRLGVVLGQRGHPLAADWPDLSGPAVEPPVRSSAVETFERASFHRGRNDFLYHSVPLGAALERLDLPGLGWSDGAELVRRLRSARAAGTPPDPPWGKPGEG